MRSRLGRVPLREETGYSQAFPFSVFHPVPVSHVHFHYSTTYKTKTFQSDLLHVTCISVRTLTATKQGPIVFKYFPIPFLNLASA